MLAPPQLDSLAANPFYSPLVNGVLLAAANPLDAVTTQELQANNGLSLLLSNITSDSQAVQNTSQTLLQILEPVTGAPTFQPAFQQRIATATNSTVAFATASPNAKIGVDNLVVSGLAKAQSNLGPSLTSSAASGVNVGNNSFNVTINGQTTGITVAIAAGDTNQSDINKLANAINQANIGLYATTVTSGSNSQISIVSNNTGTKNAFSIYDVTGNLISKTGAGGTLTGAQDASFFLNGTPMTSSTNTIPLDNGNVSLNLVATSPNPASIVISPNTNDIVSAVTNFANAYNSLQSDVSHNLNFLPQIKNLSSSTLISNSLASQLQQVGISVKNETLSVDPGTVTQAVNGNFTGLQSALGGTQGLATLAGQATNNVVQFPPSLFGISIGQENSPENLQIMFLLNNSGILQPFIFQNSIGSGLILNTVS